MYPQPQDQNPWPAPTPPKTVGSFFARFNGYQLAAIIVSIGIVLACCGFCGVFGVLAMDPNNVRN